MSKKILLTGGAGFIGFHVAKRLLEEGHSVVSVDNVNNYYDPKIKESRLKILEDKYKQFKIHRVDLTNAQKLDEIFKSSKFDKVCHLAAQAGVRYSLENPMAYEMSNNVGTLNIFEMCRKYDIEYLVYASSSSVYGKNTKQPFSETDRVDSPKSLYAATKRYNELMAHTYYDLFGIKSSGLRFFTVYGPWGRPDMALFLFTDKIINNEVIDVYNNGEMKRDFTYISDIVDGVVTSLFSEQVLEVFNLARGETRNLMEYISAVEENLGKKAKINFMPLQKGDVVETSGDIEKAKKMLGYAPKVSIEEGIDNFVKWYKGYYNK